MGPHLGEVLVSASNSKLIADTNSLTDAQWTKKKNGPALADIVALVLNHSIQNWIENAWESYFNSWIQFDLKELELDLKSLKELNFGTESAIAIHNNKIN